eukprot:346090-Chlamydomonas_euryale.AAC.10
MRNAGGQFAPQQVTRRAAAAATSAAAMGVAACSGCCAWASARHSLTPGQLGTDASPAAFSPADNVPAGGLPGTVQNKRGKGFRLTATSRPWPNSFHSPTTMCAT